MIDRLAGVISSGNVLNLSLGLVALSFVGCAAVGPVAEFDSPAWRPQNSRDVSVKVSLENRMVYVMEGNRPLLVTPTCIGTPANPTPRGNFTAYKKIEKKRSYTYGFHVVPSRIVPGKSSATPSGARYVGYPMPYWVEFKAGYGFHAGSVWPMPRSHGCLRLHPNVAPKFFALVGEGTPVNISLRQPEDATLGRNIARPQDFADPDPPAAFTISSATFPPPPFPLFENDRVGTAPLR